MATPEAVESIQLEGELKHDNQADEESDSVIEEEGEEWFQEDNSQLGEVVLLAIEMLREHQKGDTDCHSLAQWVNATTTPTRDGTVAKMKAEQLLQHPIPSMEVVLSEVMFAYKTSIHSCTIGFTPYLLMFDVLACVSSEILIGLPKTERTPAPYDFNGYQKSGVPYEAAGEMAYTASKRAKNICVNNLQTQHQELWSSTIVDFRKCGITQMSSSTNHNFHKCEFTQLSRSANVNSTKVDSMHNTRSYVRLCEGFAELLLEMQVVELAHRYAMVFLAYNVVVAKRCPLLMEYGLTQESQFHLPQQLGTLLSSTASFEMVYKLILVGDGIQLLRQNPAFPVEYRNALREVEAYPADIQVDPLFLSCEEDPKFEVAASKGVEERKHFLAKLFATNEMWETQIALFILQSK